jgi:hypothetical protein
MVLTTPKFHLINELKFSITCSGEFYFRNQEKSNSGIYHIILRGINRQSIFEDDEDRQKLIEILSKSKN